MPSPQHHQTDKSSSQPQEAEKTAANDANGAGTEPQDHPVASIFDPFLKQKEFQWWGARNINAMTEMLSASMHGAMRMSGEATRFLNERVHEDMEAAKQFSACRTGEDVFRTGSAFFDNAVRAYADETAKMVHLAADASAAVCKPFEDRTKEALHSVASIPRDNGMFA